MGQGRPGEGRGGRSGPALAPQGADEIKRVVVLHTTPPHRLTRRRHHEFVIEPSPVTETRQEEIQILFSSLILRLKNETIFYYVEVAPSMLGQSMHSSVLHGYLESR